jgi:hypothetical protein
VQEGATYRLIGRVQRRKEGNWLACDWIAICSGADEFAYSRSLLNNTQTQLK